MLWSGRTITDYSPGRASCGNRRYGFRTQGDTCAVWRRLARDEPALNQLQRDEFELDVVQPAVRHAATIPVDNGIRGRPGPGCQLRIEITPSFCLSFFGFSRRIHTICLTGVLSTTFIKMPARPLCLQVPYPTNMGNTSHIIGSFLRQVQRRAARSGILVRLARFDPGI